MSGRAWAPWRHPDVYIPMLRGRPGAGCILSFQRLVERAATGEFEANFKSLLHDSNSQLAIQSSGKQNADRDISNQAQSYRIHQKGFKILD